MTSARVVDNIAPAHAMPDTRINYAVKVNPAPQILNPSAELESSFDCASLQEVEMALAAGAEHVTAPMSFARRRPIRCC